MTEQTNRKRPSLRLPLMMLVLSFLGMITGFGLCSANYSASSRLAGVGIYMLLLGAGGALLSIVWLIVVAIILAIRAGRR